MKALIGFTAAVVTLAGTLLVAEAESNSTTAATEAATSREPIASTIQSEPQEESVSTEATALESPEVPEELRKSEDEVEPASTSSGLVAKLQTQITQDSH